MEKTIKIGSHDVKMKSSGAIPHIYRRTFNSDVILGMYDMERRTDAKTGQTMLAAEDVQMIEQLAYCFAKHADPENVPNDIEVWLEQFEGLDFIHAFRDIVNFWNADNAGTSKLKKKADK